MKNRRKIVLASASARRRTILKDAGVRFSVVVADYEENLNLKLTPRKLAMTLALGKALSVASRHRGSIVIGADTIVVYKGRVFGKPRNMRDATRTLKLLSGKSHTVITAYAIVDTKAEKQMIRSVSTRVTFRKLSSAQIKDYVSSGEALGKAGSYAIQEKGMLLVKKISGDLYSVAGLPIADVVEDLRKLKAI